MIFLNKRSLISSLLALVLSTSALGFTLTSCVEDADEPTFEKPGTELPDDEAEEPGDEENKDEVEDPSGEENPDDEEKPGDEENPDDEEQPGDEENPGEEEQPGEDDDMKYDPVPSQYMYPLSYVSIPNSIPQQVKEYTGFTVNFNKDNHTPNFVAWELLDWEAASREVARSDNFWQDKDLEGCPTKDYDFAHTNYQRGHMCPSADQRWSQKAQDDCFSMANMCPQLGDINEKAWANLEDKEREWAQRDGAIWIVCGPIYTDEDTQRIGAYNVRVPSAFFKAFLYIDTDEPRALGFVYPNALAPGDMKNYSCTIDQLEELTGYDFFPALPDPIENRIEAEDSYAAWIKKF